VNSRRAWPASHWPASLMTSSVVSNSVLRATRHYSVYLINVIVSSSSCFFGRPFVKRFALCYQTVVCPVCLSVLSAYDDGELWPNGWMDQDETWHADRPRPRRRCVRWGRSSPVKRGTAPKFSAHVYCCHGRPSQLLHELLFYYFMIQRHKINDVKEG